MTSFSEYYPIMEPLSKIRAELREILDLQLRDTPRIALALTELIVTIKQYQRQEQDYGESACIVEAAIDNTLVILEDLRRMRNGFTTAYDRLYESVDRCRIAHNALLAKISQKKQPNGAEDSGSGSQDA